MHLWIIFLIWSFTPKHKRKADLRFNRYIRLRQLLQSAELCQLLQVESEPLVSKRMLLSFLLAHSTIKCRIPAVEIL